PSSGRAGSARPSETTGRHLRSHIAAASKAPLAVPSRRYAGSAARRSETTAPRARSDLEPASKEGPMYDQRIILPPRTTSFRPVCAACQAEQLPSRGYVGATVDGTRRPEQAHG